MSCKDRYRQGAQWMFRTKINCSAISSSEIVGVCCDCGRKCCDACACTSGTVKFKVARITQLQDPFKQCQAKGVCKWRLLCCSTASRHTANRVFCIVHLALRSTKSGCGILIPIACLWTQQTSEVLQESDFGVHGTWLL